MGRDIRRESQRHLRSTRCYLGASGAVAADRTQQRGQEALDQAAYRKYGSVSALPERTIPLVEDGARGV